jgi:hypothetical protein
LSRETAVEKTKDQPKISPEKPAFKNYSQTFDFGFG